MAEVTVENSPRKVKDLFHKAFGAMERGNLDYAINLFFECIKAEPRLLQARKYLRICEVQKAKRGEEGVVSKTFGRMKALPAQMKIHALIKKGKPLDALLVAEELLREDPHSTSTINLFVEAAIKADLPEAAAMTLEAVRDRYSDDVAILKRLGEIYQVLGNHGDARVCFERVCQLKPNDPDAVRALKNAMALHSMKSDGWAASAERGGSFREMMKDSREAVLLEQESKAVKSERDSENLIAEMLQKIAAEPGNVNYYRALARLYVQRKLFDDAMATLRKAMDVNPGDPELENSLSSVKTQRFDHEIAQLREAGDEDGVAALETEKSEFVFSDLQDRVKRYPNDQKLRYELGLRLFERGMINEAVQQFQFSQRNPRFKTLSQFHIGLCFAQKEQYDFAAEQFVKAMEDIPGMDATKKSICYELGVVSEKMGDTERALECFKKIYQVDIGYRDVAQKIEQMYGRQ